MITFVASAIPVSMAHAEHLTITGSSDEEFFGLGKRSAKLR
jgi:hypothetical protein